MTHLGEEQLILHHYGESEQPQEVVDHLDAWIGVLDLVFGSGMFMFGALLAVLALGWGLGVATAHRELATGLPPLLGRGVMAWVRFIVPGSLADRQARSCRKER